MFFLTIQMACVSKPPKIKKTFFWQVSNSKKSFYILGSLHRYVSSEELPEYVHEKLLSSDLFVMETLPRLTDAQKPAKFINSKYYSLKKLLTEEEWKQLSFIYSFYLRRVLTNEDIVKLDKTSPQYIIEIISNHIMKDIDDYFSELYKKGYVLDEKEVKEFIRLQKQLNRQNSIDFELWKLAIEKRRVLEELDRNSRLMNKITTEIFKTTIKELLASSKKFQNKPLEVLQDYKTHLKEALADAKAYRSGNLLHFQEQFKDPQLYGDSDFRNNLIEKRNKEWVDTIDWFFSIYDSAFIVVGLAHLYDGPENLLTLLKKRGYQVDLYPPNKNSVSLTSH